MDPTKPREQLARTGPDGLTLIHAIILILGSGTARWNVERLAGIVARHFQEGKMSYAELVQIPGLGPAKTAALVAALRLRDLIAPASLSDLLISPEAVYKACADLLEEEREHLVVFFLSIRNRLIRREVVSIGTAASSLVHPREVFRPAILHNAQSIIVAHNHPSGDPEPSTADCTATKVLARAGLELGIELLDHVICSRSGYVLLKERHPSLFP